MPERLQDSNKGTFGKVLNFSGSKNYIGAAYLSSVSVLKTGGGFVALSTEKNIIQSVSTLLPEAIYLSRKEGLNDIKNYTVVLIGCGLGLTLSSKNLFKKVLKRLKDSEIPIIIDADGLNILSQIKIDIPKNTIITPHPKEAARLLGVSLETVLEDTNFCARQLQQKYNCVVVLKTHRTIICDKDNLFVNQHGNSALAKAGTGDVLAGTIAGLCAQKMSVYEAAKLGVYLHSIAAEIASKEGSEFSLLASELPNYIAKAIKLLVES